MQQPSLHDLVKLLWNEYFIGIIECKSAVRLSINIIFTVKQTQKKVLVNDRGGMINASGSRENMKKKETNNAVW